MCDYFKIIKTIQKETKIKLSKETKVLWKDSKLKNLGGNQNFLKETKIKFTKEIQMKSKGNQNKHLNKTLK